MTRGRLRVQLAVAGFAAIYVPVLVLFVVAYLTEDVSVSRVDGVEASSTISDRGFGWLEAAVIALAPVAALLSWWWAGRGVRPIEHIRSVAERIEATDLTGRIALTRGPTEIVSLAASFDAMLHRLHRAATGQRRVLDDIGHELRTPIAVLIANADVALSVRQTGDGDRESVERSRRIAQNMQAIVERLLLDARNNANTLDRHPADLMEIMRTIVSDMRTVADPDRVTIDVTGPGTVTGRWDGASITRAITNLIDNAVRHAPRGTSVDVNVDAGHRSVEISVSDHGPGIPPDQQDLVFERAWRSDVAGTGAGLGLAIARQIAHAHGGTLTVRSPDPRGYATTFTLTLDR